MRPRIKGDAEASFYEFTAQLKNLEKTINERRLRRGKRELKTGEFEWRNGPNTFDKNFIFKMALESLRDNSGKLDKNKYIREVD